MSYFAPYLDQTGLHIPTYADRLEALLSAYRSIFGAEASLSESSPDYQLLSVFARALDDFSALLVSFFSSGNPNYASGAALDLLLPLQALTRAGATHSTAILTLTGTPDAVLSAAPRVLDDAGFIWACAEGIHLDAEGTARIDAVCETPGAISAPAHSICHLVSPIDNLIAITNPAAAIPGLEAETDASARSRMRLAASAPSLTGLESMRSEILKLPYAKDCRIYVNDTDTADAEKGIPAHSICVVSQGGSKAQIGEIIFRKKAPGIGTWGNQIVNVTDSFGFTHEVCFKRASTRYFTLNIYITPREGFDEASLVPAIREKIKDYISGLGIGEDLVLPALYGVAYSADNADCPTFLITRLFAEELNEGTFVTDVLSPTWEQRFALLTDQALSIIINT